MNTSAWREVCFSTFPSNYIRTFNISADVCQLVRGELEIKFIGTSLLPFLSQWAKLRRHELFTGSRKKRLREDRLLIVDGGAGRESELVTFSVAKCALRHR